MTWWNCETRRSRVRKRCDLVAGFGLTITNLLCGRLGKELHVDSTIDVGTTFTFSVKSKPAHPRVPTLNLRPLEKARSFRHSQNAHTYKNAMSVTNVHDDPVPALGLRPPDGPVVRTKSPRHMSDDELDRMGPTTQEFGSERHVHPIRLFCRSHMEGGFSARGTTAKDTSNPAEGMTLGSTFQTRNSPLEFKNEVPKEPQEGLDKPLLIACERGDHSAGNVGSQKGGFSDRLGPEPKSPTRTAFSFLPGKDIAENRDFLRALVENDLPGPCLSTRPSQRQPYGQSMTHLNHPCKCPIVLIVDDTEINKIVLSGMLSRLGILHVEACNGLEALDVLREHNGDKRCQCSGIQLVLMDCGMPVMNGFEATQEIQQMVERKEITPTKVVAVTAYEGASIEQECKEAGMVEYLNKPVSVERLQQCLHDYLKS